MIDLPIYSINLNITLQRNSRNPKILTLMKVRKYIDHNRLYIK